MYRKSAPRGMRRGNGEKMECIGIMEFYNGTIVIDGDAGKQKYIFYTPQEAANLYIEKYKMENPNTGNVYIKKMNTGYRYRQRV